MKGGRASGKGKEGGKGGRRIPIIKRSDGVRNEGVRVSFFFFLLFLFRERERRANSSLAKIGALLRVFVGTRTFITRLIILIAGELSFFINLDASP